jgi:hypothetical protein
VSSHSAVTRTLATLLFVVFSVTGNAPTAATREPGQIDLSAYELRPIYQNDFSRSQKIVREEDLIVQSDGGWRRRAKPDTDAEWIAEGWGGAEILNGRLLVAPSTFDASGVPLPVDAARRSHMVVWNRQVFPADFLFEVEMNPCGSTNGLAIILFCATGLNGEDIFDPEIPPRRADYAAYHSSAIANYTDSYWSRNTEAESLSNRLRKNPGPSLTTGPTNVTHRLRILKIGGHIEVEINGRVVNRWDDQERPLGAGRIGLRSMEGVTMVAYDNFRVWQVTRRTPR